MSININTPKELIKSIIGDGARHEILVCLFVLLMFCVLWSGGLCLGSCACLKLSSVWPKSRLVLQYQNQSLLCLRCRVSSLNQMIQRVIPCLVLGVQQPNSVCAWVEWALPPGPTSGPHLQAPGSAAAPCPRQAALSWATFSHRSPSALVDASAAETDT